MGIVERKNYLFLHVSCGNLINKKKAIKASAYEGIFISITEKEDEYDGKPVTKVEVKMKDPETGEIAIIQFTQESWFTLGFFARIQKIDLAKKFTIGVMPSEQNEKMSFCYLKQEGIAKVEADKNFPKPGKTKVGKKDVMNWAAPLEAMQAIVAEMNAKVTAPEGAKPDGEAVPVVEDEKGDDDLPF